MTSDAPSQRIVTLKVASLDDAMRDFRSAWTTGQASEPSIAFASWDLMHKALSPKRLAILRTLCGQGPMSIRELARRIDRDFKGVHSDVTALLNAGLLDREGGGISFPYDGVHVAVDIGIAA